MARVTVRPAGRTLSAPTALLALAAATSAVFMTLALGSGTAPAAACSHTRAHPREVRLTEIRSAITCLVNKERTRRDRRPLKRNRRLKLAAKRHNEEMLARDCFSHRCKGERGLTGRVRATGYTRRRKAWRVAEILGYENTPRQMIGRWMNSGVNRRRILKADFRDIGVGVGWGAPVAAEDDSRFATYTIVFGWRRP
jgi:uncharacterized protein YkwD